MCDNLCHLLTIHDLRIAHVITRLQTSQNSASQHTSLDPPWHKYAPASHNYENNQKQK